MFHEFAAFKIVEADMKKLHREITARVRCLEKGGNLVRRHLFFP